MMSTHDLSRFIQQVCYAAAGFAGSILIASAWLTPLAAEDGPPRFHDVESWRGSLVASAEISDRQAGAGWSAINPWKNGVSYNAVFTVDFVLDEYEEDPSVWTGRVTSANLEASYRGVAEGLGKRGAIVENVFNTSGPVDDADKLVAKLAFHRERGWSFHVGTVRRKTELTETITLKETGKKFTERRQISVYGLNGTGTLPYPEKRMVLFASEQTVDSSQISSANSAPFTWTYTVYLEPTSMDELRLEIEEPADYKTWRPTTTPERAAGAPLEVKATLISAKGGKPNAKIERFVWELKATSFEPGVALNYPRDVGSVDFDLELAASGEFFQLSEKNQRMERAVRDGYSDQVKVVPYDWGGWSTLEVTAVLTDGRRVTGKLKGKDERGLRIPKRDRDSYIADVWKEKNKRGADDLDDENEPVGDGNKGDGFSLYEEYRGFVIRGQHVEGDPKAKDFFVLNGLGADAEPGIALFESLSGFRVHTTESTEEISPAERLINGNRAKGANVVDQHGVYLAYAENAAALAGTHADVFGAKTVAVENTSGVAFRPGITKIIGILPRGHAESLFTEPGYLPASDAIFTFDRAVAHELMHSVGVVEHGGAGDGQLELVFVSPKNAANSQGRPYFAKGWSQFEPVEILDENKRDVAAQMYVLWAANKAAWMASWRDSFMGKPGDPDYPRRSEESFEQIAEGAVGGMLGLKGLVGAEHGPHSGDQDCIMRYHFARFYPVQGRPEGTAFYMIAPGAERIGLSLCTSAAGTGVNGGSHSPQSRHGDAASGGGNCAAQICANDNVAPRPSAF